MNEAVLTDALKNMVKKMEQLVLFLKLLQKKLGLPMDKVNLGPRP